MIDKDMKYSRNKPLNSKLDDWHSALLSMLAVVVDGITTVGVTLLATGIFAPGDDPEESQSKLLSIECTREGLFWDTGNKDNSCGITCPVFIKASSCACALLKAVCIAMTLWRSEVNRHFSHLQERKKQYLLCPLRGTFFLWFRHLAQFGGVRGDTEVLDAFTSSLLS